MAERKPNHSPHNGVCGVETKTCMQSVGIDNSEQKTARTLPVCDDDCSDQPSDDSTSYGNEPKLCDDSKPYDEFKPSEYQSKPCDEHSQVKPRSAEPCDDSKVHACDENSKLCDNADSKAYNSQLCDDDSKACDDNSKLLKPNDSKTSDKYDKPREKQKDYNLNLRPKTCGQERRFLCKQSQKCFTTKKSLQDHIKTHTSDNGSQKTHHHKIPTSMQSVVCEVCGIQISSRKSLKIHMRTHTKEKPFQCELCGNKFSTRFTLQTHLQSHMNVQPFKCEYCEKSYSRKGVLNSHMRIHSLDESQRKRYQCTFCEQVFSTGSHLKVHIRIHTLEKPYECKVCYKRYSQSNNLAQHAKIHTNEKAYQCEYCGKNFSHPTNLKTHIRSHTNEKPYSCQFCQLSFSRSNNMKRHIKVKHGSLEKTGQTVSVKAFQRHSLGGSKRGAPCKTKKKRERKEKGRN